MSGRKLASTAVAGIILAASCLAFAQNAMNAAVKTGYAPVNGLNLYYEIHGTGEPLILLHGGLGAAEMFEQILPSLSNNRQVITVDYQLYSHLAPKPSDWPQLLTKLGQMLGEEYDWPKDVAAIKLPALLVFGDADAVRTTHAVQFFELLGGGKKDGGWDGSGMSNARLAMLPRLTHYSIFSSPALPASVMPFLDAPMPGGK